MDLDKESPYINILAIDPSSNEVGIAKFKIHGGTKEIISIDTVTVYLKPKGWASIPSTMSPLHERMMRFKSIFTAIMRDTRPITVVHESAFVDGGLRASAVIPLASANMLMSNIVYEFNKDILVHTYTPPRVKNALGAKGNCKKEVMLETFKRHPLVNKFLDYRVMTEHEIDAVAVGLCAIRHYKLDPHILI